MNTTIMISRMDGVRLVGRTDELFRLQPDVPVECEIRLLPSPTASEGISTFFVRVPGPDPPMQCSILWKRGRRLVSFPQTLTFQAVRARAANARPSITPP